jgi:hypothetical protein
VRFGQGFVFLAALFAIAPNSAAHAGERIDYEQQIKPLLRQRCFACHGALKQKAGLRLDSGALIRKGGTGGPVIEPAHADESVLIERVCETNPSLRMPPEGSPLTNEQIAVLRAWIDQGADSPPSESPEADPRHHWAFQPPVRPAIPGSTARSPIDAFLEAERARAGVEPQGCADPHHLIRRLYLDLTGLPPTRAELAEFLRDSSDKAYERIVDRLLASPRHGERWARHWMDVWRYSDWYGRRAVPDVLNSYGQIWRWRDWIIRAINEDRGYDSMLRSMLAADELTPRDRDEVVATGFIVRNFYRWNYELWLKDNVEHTAKAFLGLTFQCALCHDHKYDPIKQEDYFAFRAIFSPIELRHDRVPGEPDPGLYPSYEYGKPYAPITSGLVRVYDKNPDAKTYIYTRGDSRNVVPGRPPISPGMPRILSTAAYHVEPVGLPVEVAYPGTQEFVRREEIGVRESNLKSAEAAVAQAKAALAKLKPPDYGSQSAKLALATTESARSLALAELSAIHARIAADDARRHDTGPKLEALSALAARAETWAAVCKAALEAARSDAAQLAANTKPPAERKNLQSQADAARRSLELARAELAKESTTYTPLGPTYPSKSSGRRAALARWITDRSNPLAARVAVNHIWRWHFGTPLVATTHDFGRNGARPTHPELLDWLAVELMEPRAPGARPWSMKALHRIIVLSDAYKMSSRSARSSKRNAERDPANRTYWHFPSTRMEAEEVRDSLLLAAGTLDPKMGGPDIDFAKGMSSGRRSIYFTHHGEARMPFLEVFDAADVCDAYKRTISVVPQQSLALVNNEFLLELSSRLSERLWRESTSVNSSAAADPKFIAAAFETILSRPPAAAELTLSARFLAEQARIIGAASTIPAQGTRDSCAPNARRDLVHSLFNHTDFVTIR